MHGSTTFNKKSEEGMLSGLAWIEAETKKINNLPAYLKIPHMGWNEVKLQKRSSLFVDINMPPRFYFAHSYHIVCDNKSIVLATSHYGYEFVAAVEKENILGVQFHPEKSHKFGMRILKNFVALY